jgi:hypothetical protein
MKTKEKLSLWFYTFSNSELNKMSELTDDVKIWDIEVNNNFMLTSSQRSEKDLLLLTLKNTD